MLTTFIISSYIGSAVFFIIFFFSLKASKFIKNFLIERRMMEALYQHDFENAKKLLDFHLPSLNKSFLQKFRNAFSIAFSIKSSQNLFTDAALKENKDA